jgi:exodeoxyribonuclease-3
MQFATWNVNSLNIRLPQVLDWLAANPVDVLALQELKMADDKFPLQAFTDAGWHAVWHGQKTYNGVALISREPARDVVKNNPHFPDDHARLIAATFGSGEQSTRVIGGYFPNGQAPDSDKFVYKMAWLSALREWVNSEMTQHPRLLVMGDYNITFDARDTYDPESLEGTIHCTEAEREHLQALIALGLHDSLRLFNDAPKTYTWWDYRNLAFRKNQGYRIDHILISDALKAVATDCVVDKAPRKNERPSDHTPVVLTTRV